MMILDKTASLNEIDFLNVNSMVIAKRRRYAAFLPNDIAKQIFNFLSVEMRTSNDFSLVSYQFYLISKDLRLDLNKHLNDASQKIIEILDQSCNSSSIDTLFGVPMEPVLKQQRFLFDFNNLYDASKMIIPAFNIKQENINTNDELYPELDQDVYDLQTIINNPKSFLLIDIQKTSCEEHRMTIESGKVKLFKHPSLPNELHKLALHILKEVNQDRT